METFIFLQILDHSADQSLLCMAGELCWGFIPKLKRMVEKQSLDEIWVNLEKGTRSRVTRERGEGG